MPDLDVDIRPFGPDEGVLREVSRRVLQGTSLRTMLGRRRVALLSVEALEPEGARKRARPARPNRFRATIFDYRENRSLFVYGTFEDVAAVEVEESGIQPLPSPDEFAQAVHLVQQDAELGSLVEAGRLRPYRPMPPLVMEGQPDDREHRVLAVGLAPAEGTHGHEIVGVDMIDRSILRFEEGAPPASAAHNAICGQPYAGQVTVAKGAGGQVWVTVKQGGPPFGGSWLFVRQRRRGRTARGWSCASWTTRASGSFTEATSRS